MMQNSYDSSMHFPNLAQIWFRIKVNALFIDSVVHLSGEAE